MKLRLSLGFFALACAAFAQPSATMRPELLASFEVNYSRSSKEDIARGPTTLGQLAVERFGLSASSRYAWNQQTALIYGVSFETFDFKFRGALPIPQDLTEVSLNLGVQTRFGPQWSGAVYLRPGFYGEREDGFDSDALNAPLLALATFAQSRDLVWMFGVNVNAFSDNPVLPVAGVRWNFAPEWTFNVGFPRSGLIWKFAENADLTLGASFAGGSFRLTRNLGVPAVGIARLENTYVDFREVRVGVALDYRFSDRLALGLDVGAVTDRKIDYFDRNYRLDGDRGTYFALSLKGSF